jgi:ferric-dicitrate binding protein FerR (iron transport regulator)
MVAVRFPVIAIQEKPGMLSMTRIYAVAAGLAVAVAALPVQAQERIGVAAAIVNEVTGSQGNRRVGTSDQVFQNETIRTANNASASLLFRDQTSLAIGPGSDVRLDKFVFNPSGAATNVAVTVGTGALRFVTGTSNPGAYEVNTPVATIGVRGTIFDVRVLRAYTVIVLTEGRVIVTTGGKAVEITRPGDMVVVRGTGVVEGPKSWDGRIYGLRGPIPWPLFGWDLATDRSTRAPVYDRSDIPSRRRDDRLADPNF